MTAHSTRIPLGVPDLDSRLGGGVLPGYTVLTLGELGTGHREFLFTAALFHGIHQSGGRLPGRGDAYAGEHIRWPESVHYVSLSQTQEQFERELSNVINRDWISPVLDGIEFTSFLEEFASLSTLARLMAAREKHNGTIDIPVTPQITIEDYRQFLRTLGEFLINHAERNLIIFDGMTSLIPVLSKVFDWQEMYTLLATYRQQFSILETVFLTVLDRGLPSRRELEVFKSSYDGVLEFSWGTHDGRRERMMTLLKFRELLSNMEEQELRDYEIDLEWGGVGIKNMRRIAV